MVRSSMIRTAANTIEPEDSLRRGCSKLARLWLLDGAAMLYQSPASVNCAVMHLCSNALRPQAREFHTHEPMYFNDLTAPLASDKFNGDKTTNRIGNEK